MKKVLFALTMTVISMTACAAQHRANTPDETTTTEVAAKPLLDLTMPDTTGTVHHLKDMIVPGHYTLIDFWASWCPPCRGEMPGMKALYEKYHEKGYDMIGVSFDQQRSAWVNAINNLAGGLPWQHISDLKGWRSQGAEVYNVRGIPHTLLVGPEGTIIAEGLRSEQLSQILLEIYGE